MAEKGETKSFVETRRPPADGTSGSMRPKAKTRNEEAKLVPAGKVQPGSECETGMKPVAEPVRCQFSQTVARGGGSKECVSPVPTRARTNPRARSSAERDGAG